MNLTTRTIRPAENFKAALEAIERVNGTDSQSTSQRKYEDVFSMLDTCIDVARFHCNVKREVGKLNCDSDTTSLATAGSGVHFEGTARTVSNAIGVLAQKCNESVTNNGSLATYKIARNKYQNQRLRNETVARHVYAQIKSLLGSHSIYRSADYTAMIVGEVAFVMSGNRFYIVSQYEIPGKRTKKALKQIGFHQSTTSMIMYFDAENADFNTIARNAIQAMQLAVSSEIPTARRHRILAQANTIVA